MSENKEAVFLPEMSGTEETTCVGLNGLRFATKEELKTYANTNYLVNHTRKVAIEGKKPYYVSTSRQLDLICTDKACQCLIKGRCEKGKGASLKDRPWYIQDGSRLTHCILDEAGVEQPCSGGKKRNFTSHWKHGDDGEPVVKVPPPVDQKVTGNQPVVPHADIEMEVEAEASPSPEEPKVEEEVAEQEQEQEQETIEAAPEEVVEAAAPEAKEEVEVEVEVEAEAASEEVAPEEVAAEEIAPEEAPEETNAKPAKRARRGKK